MFGSGLSYDDKLDLRIHRNLGHLWKKDQKVCQCGLWKGLKTEDLDETNFLALWTLDQRLTFEKTPSLPETLEQNPVILDHYESKRIMFSSAMEASQSFQSVGKILSVI